jgi:putative photosynthetic complex assembly protein
MPINPIYSKISPSIKAFIICIALSLFGYFMSTLFVEDKNQVQSPIPVQVKILKFEDRQDGGVTVIDAATNQIIDVVQGEAGFIRGILRTVARERRIRGLGKEDPVNLMSFNDGRLVLLDPLTNTQIELESFGSINVESFKVFMKNSNS